MDMPNVDLDKLAAMEFSTARAAISVTENPRMRAVNDAACSLGARAGLLVGSKDIRIWLDEPQNQKEWDEAYEFGSLMLENGVLPPVISYSTKLVSQNAGGYAIRSASEQYTIVAPARFTTVVPTWRDWLYVGLALDVPGKQTSLEMPPDVLLAKTTEEKQVWSNAVRKCWQDGVNQAKSIYDVNRDRLIRDWTGMSRYRIMVANGSIDQPTVNSIIEAVIRKPQELTIGDVSREITIQPTFNASKSNAIPKPIKQ